MSAKGTKVSERTLPKRYNPQDFEDRLYDWWDKEGFFRPEYQEEHGLYDPNKPPFVITMPPPNVTGTLHMGHALTASIEDLMVRYHRMKGHLTLWVPGVDHAGIATQNVVERELAKEGLTRHDLGREKFLERVWQWKEYSHKVITQQHRRLGVSCDWTRERFTLDEGFSRAVRVAFVRLFKKGLIYRGNYMVNWCPRCGSAISDLEVEHYEEEGTLYTFKYPLKDGGYIPVATTRPETILGDTAVAVHPEDERYKDYIGKLALVPMLNREIPVIADERVDREFGTGALKVTPGHDPTDYEIGQDHNLPIINIMNEDGTLNENAGPYAGLDRFEARKKLWEDMRQAGLVIDEKPYVHAVGHCQRCGTVIEPLISTQWFVRTKPLAEPAIEAVRNGTIRIIPERFNKHYFHWMENIRDWCISRQLWWGHRIPVWYCDDCGHMFAAEVDPDRCEKCGSTNIHQDEDVLDTWFSSGLWPPGVLGWPDETEDFKKFYPTTMLETGYDILFFWVARMIMLGIEMTGKVPFYYVYLHGLVRDEKGRKMSKSLGNVIDPLVMIDRYGADALRFTLLTGSTPGNDMKLSEARIEASRNFANKIWNAARLVIMNLRPDQEPVTERPDDPALSLADRWILSRVEYLNAEVERLFQDYQYGEAGRRLYDFLWSEFCDWYLEIAKISLYGDDEAAKERTRRVLVYVLEKALRLLHPFMPFVTEAIWQQLPHEGKSIMIAAWPEAGPRDEAAEEAFERIQAVIRGIRNVRSEYRVEPSRRIPALIAAGPYLDLVNEMRDVIVQLARLDPDRLQVAETVEPPELTATVVERGITVYLPLAGMVDVAAERERLAKELENVRRQIARTRQMLANENFRTKAPAEVVRREEEKLAKLEEDERKLEERLQAFGG